MTTARFYSTLNEILVAQVYEKCAAAAQKNEAIINEFQQLSGELQALLDKPEHKGSDEVFEIAKNYQHWKFERFKGYYAEKDQAFVSIGLDNFQAQVQAFLNKQPRTKKKAQSRHRFYSCKGDTPWIKTIKFFKKQLFHISTIPKRFLNLFRRLFKKDTKTIRFWNYVIPFRALAALHVENTLMIELREAVNDFCSASITGLKTAVDLEQQLNKVFIESTMFAEGGKPIPKSFTLNHDPIRQSQEAALKDLRIRIKSMAEKCHADIMEKSAISGTIEYPTTFLNYQNRKRPKQQKIKKLVAINLGWGNTAFGLFEDWKIDQEIYNLNYFSKEKVDALNSEYKQNNLKVIGLLTKSKNSLNTYRDELQKKITTNSAKAANIIQEELGQLKSGIGIDNFNQASEQLITFNLPERTSQFELKIAGFLKEVSEKKWLTKLTAYDKPLSSSDLDSFSPRELISFEYLPNVEASCSTLKNQIVQHIEATRQSISNIEHVAAFNLSSVLESVQKGECGQSSIPQLVEEGLDRSENKLDEVLASIANFEKETCEKLLQITKNFIDSNSMLTVNENAFNLRIIVMKAKALKRSEEFGIEILARLKTLRRFLLQKGKIFLIKSEQLLVPWKRRIGLDIGGSTIATELSDFLLEVYGKINSLPIIYQRLYKITPLTEMSLFTGRTHEMTILQGAYKSWQKGKYAPTVIIGEKWSGHTSLINYFIEEYIGKDEVISLGKTVNMVLVSDFMAMWQETLGSKAITTPEHVIAALKEKYKGKVIILENLQNYYLRTFHGFEILTTLIQIITKTSKDIFWICSANIYAWDYLNKSMELSGYFGYVIQMQPFTDEELRELILKKNNISGYKIIYTASENSKSSKKFSKMNYEEQQLYLRDQFFNDLNAFAKGNISLALSFWLLSTSNITEESIEITNFQPPDFSFITGLNADKVFIIYLLIMHDGLGFDHLNQVYKKPEDKLQLLVVMMLDDGIIIEKNDRYEVNPLIYRHSINMLKAKNLIY
jgi:hypothetical protein